MKHSVNFKLDYRRDAQGMVIESNAPINALIRFSGVRLNYFTGYRIDAANWLKDLQTARKNSSGTHGKNKIAENEINRRLKRIKAELELFFQARSQAEKAEVLQILDAICNKSKPIVQTDAPEQKAPDKSDFFASFDRFLQVRKFSYDRTKHFKSVLRQWERYAAKRKVNLTFDVITVDRLRDFEKYLRTESTRPKAYNKPEEQIKSPKGKNSIHKILAMTRAFWNFARKDLAQAGITIPYPFGRDGYQIPGDSYGAPIYITAEERNLLFDADLKNERLQRVRDIFVFQCLIGARVGDLCKLTDKNIQNGILTYIPRKTKDGKPVPVTVPLSLKAKEILSRYELTDGRILPFITDQRYNEYLKDLFREVGIDRYVTRLNPTTGEEEQVRLCDIASSHMARRAFIGSLYGKVDSGIISSMSGHIKGSKAFSRYYDVSADLQQKAIDLLD